MYLSLFIKLKKRYIPINTGHFVCHITLNINVQHIFWFSNNIVQQMHILKIGINIAKSSVMEIMSEKIVNPIQKKAISGHYKISGVQTGLLSHSYFADFFKNCYYAHLEYLVFLK